MAPLRANGAELLPGSFAPGSYDCAMNISHRNRYLYFVVPKCASATVRLSLAPYTDIGYPVTKGVQHMTIESFLASEHASLWDAGYFRFSFVRNPYDRLYSGWLQDRYASTQSPRWKQAKAALFERVGDDFCRYVVEHVRRADRIHAWDWICWCPMHAFAYRDEALALDFVGRAEDVAGGLAALSERLGVPIAKAEDANVNVAPTTGLKYLAQYDRATVEVVNEIYADDFRLFGYEMLSPESFPERISPAGASDSPVRG